jgi:hypothetical protein
LISALIIAAGIVVILSGLAVLVIVGTALAIVGAAVLLFRRFTGGTRARHEAPRGADALELEPDFEILPTVTPINEEIVARPRVSAPDSNQR